MDPLSIASSITSFIDAGRKIAQLVTKGRGKRDQMRHLMEDVVQGLEDLKEFHLAHEKALSSATDLDKSLKRLESQLSDIHERCKELFDSPTDSQFAKIKTNVNYWLKSAQLKAEIIRLREQVQFCLLRFNTFAQARVELGMTRLALATARTEQSVLVLSMQQREQLRRFDLLYGGVLANPDEVGLSSGGNHDSRIVDVQYLRLKVQTLIEALDQKAPSEIVIPRASELLVPTALYSFTPTHQTTISKTWEALELLSDRPHLPFTPNCAFSILWVGIYLSLLGLSNDAISVYKGMIQLLKTLSQLEGGAVLLQYLALGLTNLSWALNHNDDGINACREAISIFRSLLVFDPASFRPSSFAFALRTLALALRSNGDFDDAMVFAKEALHVLRNASNNLDSTSGSPMLTWEKSAEINHLYPSASTSPRDPGMTQEESLSLFVLAYSLQSLGQYHHAYLVAEESISALQALQDSASLLSPQLDLLSGYLFALKTDLPTWVSVPRSVQPEETRSSWIEEIEDEVIMSEDSPAVGREVEWGIAL